MKKKERQELYGFLKEREEERSVQFSAKEALIELERAGRISPFHLRHLSEKLDKKVEEEGEDPADALDTVLKWFNPTKLEHESKAAARAAAPTLDEVDRNASKKEKLVILKDTGRISRKQLIEAARRLDQDSTASLESILVAVNAQDAVPGFEPEEGEEEGEEEEEDEEEDEEAAEADSEPTEAGKEGPEDEDEGGSTPESASDQEKAEALIELTLEEAAEVIELVEQPGVIVRAHEIEREGQRRVGMRDMLVDRLGELGVTDPAGTLGSWGDEE